MTFDADPNAPAGSGLGAAAAAGAIAGAARAAEIAPYISPASPQHHQGQQQQHQLQKPQVKPEEPSIFSMGQEELAEEEEKYNKDRELIVKEEASMAFDYNCSVNATEAEKLADEVLIRLKKEDQDTVFETANKHNGYGNQQHDAFAGDHFLTNVKLIEDTKLFKAARHLPKGAHLHIHFNACLKPRVLLDLAEKQDRMFITSDLPLIFLSDENGTRDPKENFYLCEIQFSIMATGKEGDRGNLFDPNYKPRQTMRFKDFLADFPEGKGKEKQEKAMQWLEEKLVFCEKETYDIPQTANGAWDRFNGRTRMMKGLFNYVSVYKTYTEMFLQDLLDDNIQYAEIRPNFMTTNQLWNDEGTERVDNAGIVNLIVNACETFKAKHRDKNFDGIKIIYCTPRSFKKEMVKKALEECIKFKMRWPNYIAGFDLVGQESKGFPLSYFKSEFIMFRKECEKRNLDIPFLFHCGETLDMGTDVDGNLVDALLLNSKRIGHGFALPRHPHILNEMKKKNVCVEVCPISNEVLGLTPRIGGHAVYSLLAQNVPCTINSDNGTLFQSSLSHDFYQVLVGKADMGLFGWRQLAEWSLIHSCFNEADSKRARENWLKKWNDYVIWLLKEFDADNPATKTLLEKICPKEEGVTETKEKASL
ncbi:hypothetical protein SEUCBS139899_000737 [Sporothrix eucalyptigena]